MKDSSMSSGSQEHSGCWLLFIAQIPSALFVFQQDVLPLPDFPEFLRLLGLWFGVSGVTCLSFCALLTFRHPFVERLSSGLDNLYRLHHLTGVWALLFIIGHLAFLALSNWIYSMEAGLYLFQIWDHPPELILGWLSLLLLLVVALVASKLDRGHKLWRRIHLLSIPAYFAAFYHFHSYTTAVGGLRVLLYSLLAIGLLASLARVFAGIFAYRYVVHSVEHIGKNHTVILLSSNGRQLHYRPSQYVFAKFKMTQGYSACNEFHPYTITSSPNKSELELIVKARGDCSCKVQHIVSGVPALIEGPFGGLECEAGDQVWVGGGVGMSPLLALLRAEKKKPGKVDLYYIAESDSEHVLLPLLHQAFEEYKEVSIFPVIIKKSAVDLFSVIEKKTPDFVTRTFLLSGPPQMVLDLEALLRGRGVARSKIKHESFGFLKAQCFLFLAFIAISFVGTSEAEEKKANFDSAEVALHNSAKSCWLIVRGKVYDVTSYIPKHPAPARTILDYCGKEATAAFDTKEKGKPHSRRAGDRLSSYYIGEMKSSEATQ